MNYLGADPSGMDITSTSVSAGATTTSSITGLVSQVNYWKDMVATATNAYDEAVARKELADANLALAQARAAEWIEKRKWYILGIGGSVLILGAVIVFRK